MPAASMLADFVMRKSGAAELTACTWALREGLLLGLARNTSGRTATEARRRSIMMLAKRFCGANEHGKQVARLALKLFDETALVLGLPPSARELLEYAALLHDVGHAIDHDRHNRHSYYLIKNAELLGFAPPEIEVIAQAARGHRKQAPSLDSTELQALNVGKRRVVRGMAAILRVADALDRSHFGVVRNIDVRYSPGRMIVEVSSDRDKADLELWTGERRTDLLSKLLDRRVILRQ
jgi:exopolyphosphatase/guanosine-5'-triphosphate,3'-diphosphate pyrophosphatase